MVHYIALFRVPKDRTDQDLEDMIRRSRECFHRVHEAHNFRSGRSVDAGTDHGFFISADFESRDKLIMFQDDPNYHKFENNVVKGYGLKKKELVFETDPGKDVKYS